MRDLFDWKNFGSWKSADEGRRAGLLVGGVGILAIVLVVGAWSLITLGPSIPKGSPAALIAPTGLAPTVSRTLGPTFVVPTPVFVTPSIGPLGPKVSELPPDQATQGLTTSSSSSSSSRSSSTTAKVTSAQLSCKLAKKVVRATLKVTSTGPVKATVTAGSRSRTETVSGSETVSAWDVVKDPHKATCSAVVAGQRIGPVPAS